MFASPVEYGESFRQNCKSFNPNGTNRQENFLDHPLQQSTLRQLQAFLRSPRFWMTFAIVVALFTITAWGIAISFSVGGEIVLRKYVASTFARMMVGSLVSALPIGLGLALSSSV
jgi:hypothetical protein